MTAVLGPAERVGHPEDIPGLAEARQGHQLADRSHPGRADYSHDAGRHPTGGDETLCPYLHIGPGYDHFRHECSPTSASDDELAKQDTTSTHHILAGKAGSVQNDPGYPR